MRRVLALLLSLALLMVACGGSDSSSSAGMDHMDVHGGNIDVAKDARTISVTATSFEFDPPSIEVEAGEAIEIKLRAEDLEHDFVIDELGAHVAAEAGETASGGFAADEPGAYTYYCSVAGHREAGMEGELIVG